jgi:hypothetical protein
VLKRLSSSWLVARPVSCGQRSLPANFTNADVAAGLF